MGGSSKYRSQKRANLGAYQRYLSGMNASMKQKVALTAAHILNRGVIADMGMGSGAGSFALASLYPQLQVIGVDVEPTMIDIAEQAYSLDNLKFQLGDISSCIFGNKSVDAIVNSSVLHHVTSFNGYSYERAAQTLRNQVEQLCDGGVLIVRDFLAPEDQQVLLELPQGDQRRDDSETSDSNSPLSISSAALFERFASSFRPLSTSPGFDYSLVEGASAGWRRYRVNSRHAVEFVLRKDYRRDWESELKEEYTYFTQSQFEELFAELGLRVLASVPIWNPWIVRNRFVGKFRWFSVAGESLPLPPTNYLIVGERVARSSGVRFREARRVQSNPYLKLKCYRDKRDGRVMDLANRPNSTLDVIPWFKSGEDLFMVARASYPRPLIQSCLDERISLDTRHSAGYVVEPLIAILSDESMGTTAEKALQSNIGVEPDEIRRFERGGNYYPSPGGIEEEVQAVFVEVEEEALRRVQEPSSDTAREHRTIVIEARQLLRSAQVGGLPDARLELNAYDLLLARSSDCGPWIAEDISLESSLQPTPVQPFSELTKRPSRRSFAHAHRSKSTGFLEIRQAAFDELDSLGEQRSETVLEYVLPSKLSLNTITAALIAKHNGEFFIALDDDDLPAAQCFTGNSQLLVAPAWRVPKNKETLETAIAWTKQQIEETYGLTLAEQWQLGGPYYPTLGLTPEVVHPYAIEVRSMTQGTRQLIWLRLDDAVRNRNKLRDGHLKIVVIRVAHALGLLEDPGA